MDFVLPFLLWLPVAWSQNQITRRLGITIEKVIYGLYITFSIVTSSLLVIWLWLQATGSHTIEKVTVIFGLHITFSIVTPSHLESQSNHQATGHHNRKGNCNLWTLYYLFYCDSQSPGVTVEKVIVIYGLHIYFFYCDSQSPGVTINHQATGSHDRKGNSYLCT